MDARARQEALRRLDVLVGEWVVEADFAGGEAVPVGRSVFEWTLDGQFLVQQTEAPDPVPDSTAIVSVAPGTGAYTQHYFDSRGVVRTYAMTFDGGEWRLLRERADFSPLDFRQRFTGRIEDDGNTVRGAWELAKDGSGQWERDFALTYRRRR
ncbi:hypothetical protein [Streptomyces sp. DSM 40750]|uniref:hypothetical protein n=1 Tax=Streptomyces sp. DSM 40750 TaxID=2801030 RepID=UPI00214C635D|nr:hypothetical protein [Streptomyces sp. DSM 40750]UUU19335.1 hypothetical protein JIX55_02890 [Streptomyces sp. DSM 40750]UUU27321.1 hypothetical protein JIX55_47860 [Streptomyces sp. DSM 40750]